jgi:hypothetical protein
MKKPESDRSKSAKEKDKEEIEEKRREYHDFYDWKDKGILKDLETRFQVVNPSLQLLLPIASNIAHTTKIPLGRQEKRRKEFLIGWFNKHYDVIQMLIPRLIIKDDKGKLYGPWLEQWEQFCRTHPSADITEYLMDRSADT